MKDHQSHLFFGMERRGNNGTTAFDFEFNQFAPDPATPLFPIRTLGDVLFTFEMSGSGSSGSAVPHYFIWNGTMYVEQVPPPPSLVSSINSTETPAAPWGYVTSKGVWASGNLLRFGFAEASVSLSECFPEFDPCNNVAYVQVRTRSSASATSDLKDTTRIFEFRFGGPEATASYGPSCLAQFTYDGTASKDSSGGTNLFYVWDFVPPTGVTLSGQGVTGPDGNGAYHSTLATGTVVVNLPMGVDSAVVTAKLNVIEGTACTDSTTATALTVLRPLAAAITGKSRDGQTLSVTLTGQVVNATSVQWQRLTAGGTWVAISNAVSMTLVYSSFESDTTPTVQNFTIDGGSYQGQLWAVQIRLHAVRLFAGLTCEADSAPVTLKKVTAVDP